MYAIEKNIPVPAIRINGVARYKYPFNQMEVGDSFAVPVDPSTKIGYQNVRARVCAAIAQHKKRPLGNGKQYTTRKDAENRLIRVWRTA